MGINYAGTESELKGCINDVKNVRRMLLGRAYAETDITELLEKQATRVAILREFRALLESGADRMFFAYSGHGGYELCERERRKRAAALAKTAARESGEQDARDETLVPYDYRSKGEIVDNELRAMIVAAALPERVQLVALFDCCHSGSGLDLAYTLTLHPKPPPAFSLRKNRAYPITSATVILLSGCEDAQTSADTREDGENQGAMTFSLLEVLRSHADSPSSPSWRDVYVGVRNKLAEHHYSQVPCLTAGKWFDTSSAFTL